MKSQYQRLVNHFVELTIDSAVRSNGVLLNDTVSEEGSVSLWHADDLVRSYKSSEIRNLVPTGEVVSEKQLALWRLDQKFRGGSSEGKHLLYSGELPSHSVDVWDQWQRCWQSLVVTSCSPTSKIAEFNDSSTRDMLKTVWRLAGETADSEDVKSFVHTSHVGEGYRFITSARSRVVRLEIEIEANIRTEVTVAEKSVLVQQWCATGDKKQRHTACVVPIPWTMFAECASDKSETVADVRYSDGGDLAIVRYVMAWDGSD